MDHKKHPKHGYHLEDGNGRMSTQEIIRKSLEAHDREDELDNMYKALTHMLSTPQYRMVREGNTLFLIHIIGKGECNMAIFNGDTPKKLLRNIKGFYDVERSKTNNIVDINKKYILLILNYIKKNFSQSMPNKIKISKEEPVKELITDRKSTRLNSSH